MQHRYGVQQDTPTLGAFAKQGQRALGLLLVWLVLTGCGGGLEPPSPRPSEEDHSAPQGAILWSADHATGDMSQWYQEGCGGEYNSGGGQSGITSEVARSGRYAARLHIENVDGDQGVRLFRWCEPRSSEELYYSVWLYFPQHYEMTAGWWNVFQFKSKAGSRNDPFFLLDVLNRPDGEMYLRLFDWQTRQVYRQSRMDIPVGEWFHLEVFYKSRGDETGQVTVWQDGVQLYDVTNVQTRYPDGDTQWSVNNYTSAIAPDPSVIYVDDAVISRARMGTDHALALHENAWSGSLTEARP